MSDENNEIELHSQYIPESNDDSGNVKKLPGMYERWFLDYASYVILERAVPHIGDGLKPVQRRILYTMKRMDDGRYNKVANIVGKTMEFHPHGDASIYGALVQLGQKNLLVDTQGNWETFLPTTLRPPGVTSKRGSRSLPSMCCLMQKPPNGNCPTTDATKNRCASR